MQTELFLHSRPVHSIFELLGTKENDITYSLGWALAQSDCLRDALLHRLFPNARGLEVERVDLQKHEGDSGITDIEIRGPSLYVIIEAKRGWALPTDRQLSKYALRIQRAAVAAAALVTMSGCSAEYAKQSQGNRIEGLPLIHICWREVQRLARVHQGTHAEKRLLAQFRTYLEQIVTMQDQTSNKVYVVALAAGTPRWSKLSWRQIVKKRRRYFHPFATAGYPKEPPNYLGFRYDGRLQSICHVEDATFVADMHDAIPEIERKAVVNHVLYKLGPRIIPRKPVRNGRIFQANHVWAMLDLLLTCNTISDAVKRTKERGD